MVRERQESSLVHTTAPFAVLKFQSLILFCSVASILLHIAERAGYTGIGRIKLYPDKRTDSGITVIKSLLNGKQRGCYFSDRSS